MKTCQSMKSEVRVVLNNVTQIIWKFSACVLPESPSYGSNRIMQPSTHQCNTPSHYGTMKPLPLGLGKATPSPLQPVSKNTTPHNNRQERFHDITLWSARFDDLIKNHD
jgi:hypothetical protein